MRGFILICLILLFAGVGQAEERLVLELGRSKNVTKTRSSEPAAFRMVTFEKGRFALSSGKWERPKVKVRFLAADAIFRPAPVVRFAAGLVLLNRTTDRLGTLHQLHFSAHLVATISVLDLRIGCHHFSNGSAFHRYQRSKPNHAEDFCGFAIGGRF